LCQDYWSAIAWFEGGVTTTVRPDRDVNARARAARSQCANCCARSIRFLRRSCPPN
jgi:hypothetical protein